MPEKKKPVVDYNLCMACRICISSCPFSCLEESDMRSGSYTKGLPVLSSPDDCTGCGICAKACPIDIISME